MDQRQTFSDINQLFSFVCGVFNQQQQASLLIDKDGLARVEGRITAINGQNNVDEANIIIDGNTVILIKEIVGINGVFRSEYSEC